MKKRTYQSEYKKGFKNGLLYDGSFLCKENERKMVTGIANENPLISAYWNGYKTALEGVR